MKYIEKTRIHTHIYTHIRIYARGSFTVHTVYTTKKHKERNTRNDNNRHIANICIDLSSAVHKKPIRGGIKTWKKKQTWSTTWKD